MGPQSTYRGDELDVFAGATNWKRYWRSLVIRFIGREVAEVGAGIGTNTRLFCGSGEVSRWVCLEPDRHLARRLGESIRQLPFGNCEIIVGTLEDLPAAERFDSIVYIDVIEHIDDDRAELLRAEWHLRPGGTLVILAPAHPWLFTAFDAAIGHHRRYTKNTLTVAIPGGLEQEVLMYLDSVGLLASAANRIFLRSARPTLFQVRLWDRFFVRCSRLLDPLLGHSIGKSVLGVWRKPSTAHL